jgi:hypothetical protein
VGLVDAQAYRGIYSKNPFNFQSFDLKNISVEIGDEIIPARNYDIDFSTKKYTNAFVDLYETLRMRGMNKSNGIRYEDFASGYALYGFRLSPVDRDSGMFDFMRTGVTSLRIELGTGAPLPQGIEVGVVFFHFLNVF